LKEFSQVPPTEVTTSATGAATGAAQATETPPEIRAVFDLIHARNPMHYRFVSHAIQQLTADEQTRLAQYIAFCRAQGVSDARLTESYLTIVNDTLREQARFRKEKRYRFSTFAEVADSVYFDDDYMSRYMYGLAVSSFLWPNHLDLFRFFQRTLPTAKPGRYLEIGPGHGYFLMTAMRLGAFDDFLAVDISETSINQTRALIGHFAPDLAARAQLQTMDFLDSDLPSGGFDAVVMGEVLEHVEQPSAFLDQIRRVAADDAHIYLSTCINAPAVDHITLFRDPQELERLFAASGLAIADELIRPYEGKTLEQSLAGLLPINVAYVLRKA
jgi:2-polyprenyl-3-methyl-5-hydroxy-6-metoxy-1,4-benzoquinol methylase